MKLIFIFLCSINLFAALDRNAVRPRLYDFTYEDFCQTMGAKNSFLVTPLKNNEVECFNQKYSVTEFCKKKKPELVNFTRGFVDEKDKAVYCEEAEGINLSIDCDTSVDLCKDSKLSCEKLQKIYALNLEIVQQSIVFKKLKCYYSKKMDENLYEL